MSHLPSGPPPPPPAPPPPVRLVATDLDGTLVRADGTVSARTAAALAACRGAGVHVVAVTGRPARWVVDLADLLGGATAICANGALVLDLATGAVLTARTVAPADVLRVAAALRERVPGVLVALETLAGFRHEPGFAIRHDPRRQPVAGPLEQLLGDDPGVLKVLVRAGATGPPGPGGARGARATSDDVLAAVAPVLAGIAEATHSGLGGLVEVSALGVSKATALAEHAAGLGVTAAEVAAFGDMPNDLAMLRWAGQSYAVDGGHPDVVAAAAGLAPPCEQDGVAQVLERLVLAR